MLLGIKKIYIYLYIIYIYKEIYYTLGWCKNVPNKSYWNLKYWFWLIHFSQGYCQYWTEKKKFFCHNTCHNTHIWCVGESKWELTILYFKSMHVYYIQSFVISNWFRNSNALSIWLCSAALYLDRGYFPWFWPDRGF